MKAHKILISLLAGAIVAGCAVDTDDDPDVVTTPGRTDTTIIEKDDPDVHVSPAPDVNIKTDTPGGTVTTTGQ